jgi:type II secretory pathway pseudopilin PulG
MRNERGAGLLELLLALAIFMSLLPFVYNFVVDQRERAENAAVARKIKIIQDALEQYVADNKQKLLAPVSASVARVKLSDLENINPAEFRDARIQLRIVKSKDSAGRSFVQGIVIFDSPALTPLRTRRIAASGGNSSGFAEGRMLYGSFGTWQAPASRIGAAAGAHSILAQTRPFRSGGD